MPAVAEFFRHSFARAEIDHVDGADRTDIGQSRADRRAETIAVGRKNAADHHIGDLCRGEVDEARQQAGIAEILHRPAADARRVEDQAVVIAPETLGDRLDGGRGDAEHGDADRRPRKAPARFADIG